MNEELLDQEQPIANEYKTPTEELLERVLRDTGKTRAEFDAEVEVIRQQSNPEMMAQLIAMLMMNVEATAGMLSIAMARIEVLEGGAA